VHLNGFAHAALPFDAPVVVVGHSDVCSWWRAVLGSPAPDAWHTYRRRVVAGLESADLVIAPTHAVSEDLEREYGFMGVRVIPNGRQDRWPSAVSKEPFIFAMGRMWDAAKNLLALERAAHAVEWPVMIAGATDPEVGVESTSGAAHHLGRLSPTSAADWLGRAAIFASPVKYEPFGLAALEAGLARCALVLGDLPSLREVWADTALFVDPGDPHHLADTLRQLTARPGECVEWGRRARERARRFGSGRMAHQYAGIYRTLRCDPAPIAWEDAS
jgi:glycogen(starch) synthase